MIRGIPYMLETLFADSEGNRSYFDRHGLFDRTTDMVTAGGAV